MDDFYFLNNLHYIGMIGTLLIGLCYSLYQRSQLYEIIACCHFVW
jgi:hypothetical protein